MAAWLPLIKVVLPDTAPIFQAAIPWFTKLKSEKADPLVSKEITELYEAVKTNSEYTKATARPINESAQANDKAMKRMRLIAIAAVAVAALSLALAIVSLLIG